VSGESVIMVETLKELRTKGAILAMEKAPSGGLCLIDNHYAFSHYNDTFQRVSQRILVEGDEIPQLHRYSHAISISTSHRIFLAQAKSNQGLVLDLDDDTLPAIKLIKDEGYIESSDFSSDEQLASFGSQEGRTYIYDAKSMSYLFTLAPKTDYISKLSFSNDNRYLLSSCFNGANVIYDFQSNKNCAEFTTVATLEDAVFIEGNSKIFYVLRNGASGIYDIEKAEVVTEANSFSYWPTTIVTFLEDKYVCVGTKSKHLMLMDVRNNTVMATVPLSFVGISSLHKDDDKLYIGFINGVVQIVNTTHYLDDFEIAYKVKDFPRVHLLVSKNVFLKLHPYYLELKEDSWDETLPKIMDLLARSLFEDSDNLVEPYLDNPDYERTYTVLKKQSFEITEFYSLIDQLKIQEAYAKVEKIPLLKFAPPFVFLESKWNTAFTKAKKLMQQGVTEYKRAERMLQPFAHVPSKRDLVLALMNQPEVFFESEHAIKHQNFKRYFDMTKQYPFLLQAPLHAKIELMSESFIEKLDMAEEHWELKKMKEFSDILKQFPEHIKRAELSVFKIKVIIKLSETLKKGNLKEVFALMKKYPYIKTHKSIFKIHSNYLETANKAMESAIQGDAKNTLLQLKKYWDIPACESKIAAIMKLCFFNEMQKYYKNGKVDWPTSIGRYLERFGMDDDIRSVANIVGIGDGVDALRASFPYIGLKKAAVRTSLLSAKKTA
jgi:hypothetical protein